MKSTKLPTAMAMVMAIAAACPLAFAHSFYDPECCSDRDCAPYPADKVKETAAGFMLDTGEFVPRERARLQEHDGNYHLCRLPGGPVICFYYPNRSM